jgi:hypothetical protein
MGIIELAVGLKALCLNLSPSQVSAFRSEVG